MTETTALTEWNPDSGAALPAYLLDAQNELGTNIPDRMTVPSLSYEGKTWAVVKDGNRTKLQKRNDDGDMEPISIMRMVVLEPAQHRGRAYYTGAYNPAATAQPKCWSKDGVAPDDSVREKESPTCANCPQSIKGSKVLDGREMIACSQHRLLAILPAMDLDFEPLRLKIAVTSDYDKELVEHNWFAFRQYSDYLKARGIGHTGLVVTKVKFDPNVAYPKLLFALDRLLQPGELVKVKERLKDPKIAKIISEEWSPAGVNGTPTNDRDIAPSTTTVAAQPAAEQVVEAVATVKPASSDHQPAPLDLAQQDGWTVHPQNPAFYFKGQEVVGFEDLIARYTVKPAAPSAPPPAPAAAPEAAYDPLEAARADGWLIHPQNDQFHYRGEEVVANGDLAARYPPASAGGTVTTSAPKTPVEATASPSDATEIPAEVQNLLNKWT